MKTILFASLSFVSAFPLDALAAAPQTQLLACSSDDGSVSFTVAESFVGGAYDHSGAIVHYAGGSFALGKYETGYDENVGEANIATLYAVEVPKSSPLATISVDIPREGKSLALKANVATTITVDSKSLPASCHAI